MPAPQAPKMQNQHDDGAEPATTGASSPLLGGKAMAPGRRDRAAGPAPETGHGANQGRDGREELSRKAGMG